MTLAIPVARQLASALGYSIAGLRDAFSLRSLDSVLWPDPSYGVGTGGDRRLTAGDKCHLEIASNADVELGDINFTIGFWVRPSSFSTQMLVTKGYTTELFSRIISTGAIDFGLLGGYVRTNTTLTAGTWYFVELEHNTAAVGFDRYSIRINGVDQAVTTAGTYVAPAVSADPFVFGYRPAGSDWYFDGRVSCMGLWKRLLTAAESIELFNKGNGLYYGDLSTALKTDLKPYWNFNEAGLAGEGAYDAHGTNDLTFVNSELVTNGGFDTDTGWTKGTGWTISGGVATHDGSSGNNTMYQGGKLTVGNSYITSFEVTRYVSDSVRVNAGSTGFGTSRTAVGTYVETLTASGNSTVFVQAVNTFAGDVDNVSFKADRIPSGNGPTSAIASDTSGNGNHGVLTGYTNDVTAWTTDTPNGEGYSLTFDGSANYVDCGKPTLAMDQDTLAVSIWAKFTVASIAGPGEGLMGQFSGGESPFLIWHEGTTLKGRVYNAAGSFAETGSWTVQTGSWKHICLVYDGIAVELYIDGVKQGTGGSLTGKTGTNSQTLFVGKYQTTGSFFNGNLDDPRLYAGPTALTASQVAELAAGNEATGATPVGHWPFDDGPQTSDASDGDLVLIHESRDSGRKLAIQTTAASRPTFKESVINGLPVLRHDGTDDRMTVDFGATLSQPNTVVLVAKSNVASNRHFFDGTSGSARNTFYQGSAYTIFAGTVLSGGTADANWHIFICEFNGASSKLYVDGAIVLSGDAGLQGIAGLSVGSSYIPGTFLDGDIAFGPFLVNRLLTDSEKSKVNKLLSKTFGIPLA